MGLIYVLYFTVTESSYGYTLGKALIGLKVVAADGERPNLEGAFIRNISKIFWVFLILGVAGRFFLVRGPHQKFSDRIAGTTVV
jgi:uncharacterized RDD family membrane protein YckC